MRAAMDHGVDALDLAQPEVERDIGVARRQRGVVIFALARLDAPRSGCTATISLPARTMRKAKGAVAHRRVGLGRAPGRVDGPREAAGMRREARRRIPRGSDRRSLWPDAESCADQPSAADGAPMS